MKSDEFFAMRAARRKPRHEEHDIQVSCILWWKQFIYGREFKSVHDKAPVLLAIPNGGRRDIVTAANMKAEGVVAGAADLFLCLPSQGYAGLFIEMKTAKGRQSDTQRIFEAKVVFYGYRYEVCRSLEDFTRTIRRYIFGNDYERLDKDTQANP